jgi:hypothetical protein
VKKTNEKLENFAHEYNSTHSLTPFSIIAFSMIQGQHAKHIYPEFSRELVNDLKPKLIKIYSSKVSSIINDKHISEELGHLVGQLDISPDLGPYVSLNDILSHRASLELTLIGLKIVNAENILSPGHINTTRIFDHTVLPSIINKLKELAGENPEYVKKKFFDNDLLHMCLLIPAFRDHFGIEYEPAMRHWSFWKKLLSEKN